MRWNALFQDLEQQLAEAGVLGMESEIAERSRADTAAIALDDRLRGSVGCHVGVHLNSGPVFAGTLSHAGSESLVIEEPTHQVLIPYAAVGHYTGLGRFAVAEVSIVRRKLGLASALRGLARDRAELTVLLAGRSPDLQLPGVIDRVGRDFFDLALTLPGEARRAGRVADVATVPFQSLSALRSRRGGEL
ncbi:hypothetical protein ACFVTE_05220 [Arthrobacter sp. NPDC058097]|jgi:hypothetical protein|uniref:hypothetical protein n=1 Tax=Arthrobacter sp. NPDC058097 TaxID=3346340 RepID=UPI0036D9B933